MTTIDITQLTPDQMAELEATINQQKKEAREKKKENKKALQELYDEFLGKFLGKFFETHNSLSQLIFEQMWPDFERVKELKIETWGDSKEKNLSHTITSSDKQSSMTIGYNSTSAFDGTHTAGVNKIKNVLDTLKGSDDKNVRLARKVLDLMLKTNPKTGELNADKALELHALKEEFNSEEFDEGVDVLLAARFKKQTSLFVEGWKIIEVDGIMRTVKFRFSI